MFFSSDVSLSRIYCFGDARDANPLYLQTLNLPPALPKLLLVWFCLVLLDFLLLIAIVRDFTGVEQKVHNV